jgi:hypothetical protein
VNSLLTKKHLVGITICGLLMCVAFGQVSVIQASTEENNPSTSKFIPYNNTSNYGLAFEYPENWKITERDSGVWFSSLDGSGNIGIQIQPTQNRSLQELVKIQLVQYKAGFKDFRVLSSNGTTISGNAANRTDYSFKTEEPKFLGTNLFGTDILNFSAIAISAIKNDNLYSVTYISTAENFNIFLPIAEKMLSTIRIQ